MQDISAINHCSAEQALPQRLSFPVPLDACALAELHGFSMLRDSPPCRDFAQATIDRIQRIPSSLRDPV